MLEVELFSSFSVIYFVTQNFTGGQISKSECRISEFQGDLFSISGTLEAVPSLVLVSLGYLNLNSESRLDQLVGGRTGLSYEMV